MAILSKGNNGFRRLRMGGLIIFLGVTLAACATSPAPSGGDSLAKLETKREALPSEVSAKLAALGQQALEAGDYRSAFMHFSRAVEAKPDNHDALVGLGESYLAARNFPKAASTFEKAEKMEKVKGVALQGRGIALAMMGRRDAARALLLDAVGRNPRLWRAWNALATGYDSIRDWQGAGNAYRTALEIRPDAAEIHNNLGVSYMLQNRYDDAVRAFDAALDISPNLQNARENRRLALAYKGHYLDATASVPHEDRAKVLNNVGYVAMQNGDYSIAEGYFVEAMHASASYYQKAFENLQQARYRRELEKRAKAL